MSATIHFGAFPGDPGPGELVGLVADSTFFGKFILLVLLVLSVMSWAVFIDKARTLARIRAGHQEFWAQVRSLAGPGRDRARAVDLVAWCRDNTDLPLCNLILETESMTQWPAIRRAIRARGLPGNRKPGTVPDPAVDRRDHLALPGPAGHGVGHHELASGAWPRCRAPT